MEISQNAVAFSEYMNFTNYQAFLESFEARIKIYGSKLIKKLYKSILKNQDQNFYVTCAILGTVHNGGKNVVLWATNLAF